MTISAEAQETINLRFYFDPACPWAWRASLWIREVQKVRPVRVEWDILSLQAANKGRESLKESHFKSEKGFRVMALLRRHYRPAEANQLIDRLYLALGQAGHERKEDISQDEVMVAALQQAGIDPALLSAAMEDPTTLDEVAQAHERAVEAGGFGVPTLQLTDDPQHLKATFGPVINQVPTGEDAGQLWERVVWLMQRPDFFELKRNR